MQYWHPRDLGIHGLNFLVIYQISRRQRQTRAVSMHNDSRTSRTPNKLRPRYSCERLFSVVTRGRWVLACSAEKNIQEVQNYQICCTMRRKFEHLQTSYNEWFSEDELSHAWHSYYQTRRQQCLSFWNNLSASVYWGTDVDSNNICSCNAYPGQCRGVGEVI